MLIRERKRPDWKAEHIHKRDERGCPEQALKLGGWEEMSCSGKKKVEKNIREWGE